MLTRPNDSQVTVPAKCRTCGCDLTVHVDRWNPELRLKQLMACPVCAHRQEDVFMGRVVRVTRRWTQS